jgi:hypothetical protein
MQDPPAMNHQGFDELDSLRGIATTLALNHFFLATNSMGSRENLPRTLVDLLQNGPACRHTVFLLNGFVLSIPI